MTIFDNLDNAFEECFERMKELAGDKAGGMKFVKVNLILFLLVFGAARARARARHRPLRPSIPQGDLRFFDEIDKALGAETFTAVIHFAGRKAVGESVKEPMLYYTHNVVGAVNLIEAMRKHGIKNVSVGAGGGTSARAHARHTPHTPPRSCSPPRAPCTATSNPRTCPSSSPTR